MLLDTVKYSLLGDVATVQVSEILLNLREVAYVLDKIK